VDIAMTLTRSGCEQVVLELYKVLEEKGAGQPDVVGIGFGGGDLEELQ
jgi:hypothetical protein